MPTLTGTISVAPTATLVASVTSPIPDMQVTVQFATGSPIVFDRANAVATGTYVDPSGQFTVDCLEVTNAALCNFAVVFARQSQEVWFFYGDARPGVYSSTKYNIPSNLGAFTAKIVQNGVTIATVCFPLFNWLGRYRWNPNPLQVRATAAQLYAAGLLPTFSAAVYGPHDSSPAYTPMVPMGIGTVTPDMGQTGDRADIGPITGQQAHWLNHGDAQALKALLANAEAAGTFPWNVRDASTGAPIDLVNTYPKASLYNSAQGVRNLGANDGLQLKCTTGTGTAIGPDPSHAPTLGYVPFLLTGDPWHLLTLQYQAMYDRMSMPMLASMANQTTRAQGWTIRDALYAAKMTPASVPSWLLPQATMLALLDDYLPYLQTYAAGTDPVQAILASPTQVNTMMISPWENDYLGFILAMAVWMGFSNFTAVATWIAGNVLGRVNTAVGGAPANPNGYPRARCSTERIYYQTAAGQPEATTWAEFWAYTNQECNGQYRVCFEPTDPTGMNQLALLTAGDITYPFIARAVLRMMELAGIQTALTGAGFSWLDQQLTAGAPIYPGDFDEQWMIA